MVEVVFVSSNSREHAKLAKLVYSHWRDWPDESCGQFLGTVVAKKKQQVLGGAILHSCGPRKWYVSYLVVLDRDRGIGLGSMVMKKVQELAALSLATIALHAERWNVGSRRFYERHGFRFCREEPDSYDYGDGVACYYKWRPSAPGIFRALQNRFFQGWSVWWH